jgi:hypothetical protein
MEWCVLERPYWCVKGGFLEMIPYFKDVDEVKDSGVIYNGTFD